MTIRNRAEGVVVRAVDDHNLQSEGGTPLAKRPDTVLYGQDGALDSLGLVNLLALVEEYAQEEFDMPVTLADERAFAQESSPFRTIETLARYLEGLVEESLIE
jgi:acyl carrier protein